MRKINLTSIGPKMTVFKVIFQQRIYFFKCTQLIAKIGKECIIESSKTSAQYKKVFNI